MIRIVCAGVMVLGSLSSIGAAEYDYGEMWGTREPALCGPFSIEQIPVDSLNAVLATSIYHCALEANAHGGEYALNLVEDVRLQLAKPRAFGSSVADYDIRDIDSDYPIYPFRVTHTAARCQAISDVLENEGKNCRETPMAGEGTCYVTLYGEWHCHAYVTSTGPSVFDLPPRRG
jgi:hypothetical protein